MPTDVTSSHDKPLAPLTLNALMTVGKSSPCSKDTMLQYVHTICATPTATTPFNPDQRSLQVLSGHDAQPRRLDRHLHAHHAVGHPVPKKASNVSSHASTPALSCSCFVGRQTDSCSSFPCVALRSQCELVSISNKRSAPSTSSLIKSVAGVLVSYCPRRSCHNPRNTCTVPPWVCLR